MIFYEKNYVQSGQTMWALYQMQNNYTNVHNCYFYILVLTYTSCTVFQGNFQSKIQVY